MRNNTEANRTGKRSRRPSRLNDPLEQARKMGDHRAICRNDRQTLAAEKLRLTASSVERVALNVLAE